MKKVNKKDTLDSMELAYFFGNLENKPVYVHCAYNFYRVLKVTDIGDCYILMSPEEEGCWMPSSSIREEPKEPKPKPKPVIVEEDDGPEIA